MSQSDSRRTISNDSCGLSSMQHDSMADFMSRVVHLNRSSPSPANVSQQIRNLQMRQQQLEGSVVTRNSAQQQNTDDLIKLITERNDRIIADSKQMMQEVRDSSSAVKEYVEHNSELIKDLKGFLGESKDVIVEMQKEISSLIDLSTTKSQIRQVPLHLGNVDEGRSMHLGPLHEPYSGTIGYQQLPINVSSDFQQQGAARTNSQVPDTMTAQFQNSDQYQHLGIPMGEYQQPYIPNHYYQQLDTGTFTSIPPVPGLFAAQFPANYAHPGKENTTQQKLSKSEKKSQSLKVQQHSFTAPSLPGINYPLHGAQSQEPDTFTPMVDRTEIPQELLDNVLDKVKQEMKSVEKKQQEQTEKEKVLKAQMEELFKASREMQEKLKEEIEQTRREKTEMEKKELMERKEMLTKEREHAEKLEIKQKKLEEELVKKQMEDNRKLKAMGEEIMQLKQKEEIQQREEMENVQRQLKQRKEIQERKESQRREEAQQREEAKLKLLETMRREQIEQKEQFEKVQKELEDLKWKGEARQRKLVDQKQRELKQREEMQQREEVQQREEAQTKLLEKIRMEQMEQNGNIELIEGMVCISKALTFLPQRDTGILDNCYPNEDTRLHCSHGVQITDEKPRIAVLETNESEQEQQFHNEQCDDHPQDRWNQNGWQASQDLVQEAHQNGEFEQVYFPARSSHGEDDELELISANCQIFQSEIDMEKCERKSWGDLKILQNLSEMQFRIIMMEDQSNTVRANHIITPDMRLLDLSNSDCMVCYDALDVSGEKNTFELFTIRFKNKKTAEQFHEMFNDCLSHVHKAEIGYDTSGVNSRKSVFDKRDPFQEQLFHGHDTVEDEGSGTLDSGTRESAITEQRGQGKNIRHLGPLGNTGFGNNTCLSGSTGMFEHIGFIENSAQCKATECSIPTDQAGIIGQAGNEEERDIVSQCKSTAHIKKVSSPVTLGECQSTCHGEIAGAGAFTENKAPLGVKGECQSTGHGEIAGAGAFTENMAPLGVKGKCQSTGQVEIASLGALTEDMGDSERFENTAQSEKTGPFSNTGPEETPSQFNAGPFCNRGTVEIPSQFNTGSFSNRGPGQIPSQFNTGSFSNRGIGEIPSQFNTGPFSNIGPGQIPSQFNAGPFSNIGPGLIPSQFNSGLFSNRGPGEIPTLFSTGPLTRAGPAGDHRKRSEKKKVLKSLKHEK